jgi:beta-glucosidase
LLYFGQCQVFLLPRFYVDIGCFFHYANSQNDNPETLENAMTRDRLILLFGVLMILFFSPALTPAASIFMDPDQPLEARVQNLIEQLTLEEKVSLLSYDAAAVPRLGVPKYNYWGEALHGVARAGKATVFPQAIAMAATFDDVLLHRIATAISDEARAKFNLAQAAGNTARYRGLTFWSPNINIFRDPRWGRGQETYGEDPYLTSRMAVSFIKGLQGDDPKILKAGACAKHYAVHSGPEGLRHEFNAIVSKKDLWETYLPAFEASVKAGVETVMGAYNRTLDEPCCGSKLLLVDILRNQWGFKGHVVSDCWAIQDFHQHHKVTETPEQSAALALTHGTDLNCGDTYVPYLANAVKQGLVQEDQVDVALARVLRTRFKLGLFDPPENNPYRNISPEIIGGPKHKALAREAAQKSIVLLKNNGCLPLSKDPNAVFVAGPMAANVQVLLGNYYGVSDELVTIIEGITAKLGPASSIQYRPGWLAYQPNLNPIDWYSSVAQRADVTIAVVGLDNMLEGEEGESLASPTKGDRFDIGLPIQQIEFLKKMRSNAKKLVIVVTGGSAIAMPEVHEMADALLYVWYPGQEGGHAVADVLFGDVAPSGKLPITFPKGLDHLPPFEDYAMANRTYRYMTEEPLYPFGFGLSYTTFQYSKPTVSSKKIQAGDGLNCRVNVTNTGKVTADEVAQLYLTDLEASVAVPQHALKGFHRVTLEPGQTKTVAFELRAEDIALVNEQGQRIIEPGEFKITVGGCSPGTRGKALGASSAIEIQFEVVQ